MGVLIPTCLTGGLFIDSHALVFQGIMSNAHEICLAFSREWVTTSDEGTSC